MALSSGQAYYTLESLEGATSLPLLKAAPPASLPRRESFPPLERDALLHLDAQARALVSDRDSLDARARLLAAERAALLRNLPGRATALPDQRMYADGLEALDVRARVPLDTRARALLDNGRVPVDTRARALLDNGRVLSHGLDLRPGPPLSYNRGLSHGLDVRPGPPLSDNRGLSHRLDVRGAPLSDNRGLSYGVDTHPRDPSQLGAVNISRFPPVVGGIAPGATQHGSLSELRRGRELGVGAPFLPAVDGWRDIGRAEVPDFGAQSARLFINGAREPAAIRSTHAEANRFKMQAERNKGLSNSKPLTAPEPRPLQSEGWCAVCLIDCHNIKTLGFHVNGKKHKAIVEQLKGNTVNAEAASKGVDKAEVNSVPSTSQAVKKRASDEKPETLQSAKRLKVPTPVVTSNTPMAVADIQKAKADFKTTKPTATKVLSNPSHQFCEICNISTTGKTNLESHFKGKRHATQVKKLANTLVVV